MKFWLAPASSVADRGLASLSPLVRSSGSRQKQESEPCDVQAEAVPPPSLDGSDLCQGLIHTWHVNHDPSRLNKEPKAKSAHCEANECDTNGCPCGGSNWRSFPRPWSVFRSWLGASAIGRVLSRHAEIRLPRERTRSPHRQEKPCPSRSGGRTDGCRNRYVRVERRSVPQGLTCRDAPADRLQSLYPAVWEDDLPP